VNLCFFDLNGISILLIINWDGSSIPDVFFLSISSLLIRFLIELFWTELTLYPELHPESCRWKSSLLVGKRKFVSPLFLTSSSFFFGPFSTIINLAKNE